MNDSLVVHTAPQRPVTLPPMTELSLNDALDAAAFALVGERCRHAHLHDIRGELQTLQSSLELLARSAKNPTEKIALAEKATALARRALASHEKALLEFVNQITPHVEAPAPVDVREMVDGALRFLRNPALDSGALCDEHRRTAPRSGGHRDTRPCGLRCADCNTIGCGLAGGSQPGGPLEQRNEQGAAA